MPRPLRDSERSVVELLLTREFPERDAIRAALAEAEVLVDDSEPGVLVFTGADDARKLPIEAHTPVGGGAHVTVFLHTDSDGGPSMLEWFRSDGEPAALPEPAALRVVSIDDPDEAWAGIYG